MKKSVSLILFAIVLTLGLVANAQCPFGKEVCHGECGRFTDNNDNGLCDFCKQEQNATKTPAKVEQTKTQQKEFSPRIDGKDAKEEAREEKIAPKNRQKEINGDKAEDSLETPDSDVVEAEVEQVVTQTPTTETNNKPYTVIALIIVLVALYLLSAFGVKKKVMKKATHRKIWNVILLVTFLIACLMGLLLALQMNYGFWMGAYRKLLFLHVEIGIAMTIIGLIHCFWHLSYWKNIVAKH